VVLLLAVQEPSQVHQVQSIPYPHYQEIIHSTISGNADIDGAITGITTFSVSGTSDIGANVTTSGTQIYTMAQ
jgi:hypothetical protein